MSDSKPSMSIQDQLQNDMKLAMKAREKQKLGVLRMVISKIKAKAIDTRTELSDEEVMKMLLTYAKQREDGIVEAKKAEREDLVAQEEFELEVVRSYLPKPLSDDELAALIDAVIAEQGASSIKDMGKVMKAATDKASGRADGGRISSLVKSKLAG